MIMAKKSDFNTSRSVKDLQAEYGKMPPQAVDLEEAVLGALMLERDAFSIVGDLLEPDAFYKDAHQKIFRAIHKLFLNDDPVDLLTVSEALKQSGELEQVGGYYYLSQLTTRVASAAHIEFHAKIIVQKYLQRKLIGVCTELQEMAYDEATDVSDLMDKAQKAVFDIADGNIKKDTAEIAPIIDEAIKGIQAAAEKPDGISGLPSGFNALDAVTSGWQPSDLVIIAARPAMGKTSFALNLAQNITMGARKKCIVFSLEMQKTELAERLLSSQAGVESQKLKTGELTDEEWVRLGNAAATYNDVELYLDDTSAITVPEIKSRVRRMRGVDCIIIDYLGLISSATKKENRVQEVSEITRSLKMMAKDLNIPVICCAQLSRGTEGHGKNHKPQLADLRESGSIEQDADIVLFLYREAYYSTEVDEDKQDQIDANKTELIVAKNRHGATGSIELTFDKEYTRFRSVDKSNYE